MKDRQVPWLPVATERASLVTTTARSLPDRTLGTVLVVDVVPLPVIVKAVPDTPLRLILHDVRTESHGPRFHIGGPTQRPHIRGLFSRGPLAVELVSGGRCKLVGSADGSGGNRAVGHGPVAWHSGSGSDRGSRVLRSTGPGSHKRTLRPLHTGACQLGTVHIGRHLHQCSFCPLLDLAPPPGLTGCAGTTFDEGASHVHEGLVTARFGRGVGPCSPAELHTGLLLAERVHEGA
mmetsp:Transcript_24661/g.42282  ORF Transcript_24661/g.42282 Transcript_24661/m.42282 type:complete len:234 (+) Transcript_24661:2544-3245(+)